MRKNDKQKLKQTVNKVKSLSNARPTNDKSGDQWRMFVLQEDLEPGADADAKPAKWSGSGWTAYGDKTWKVQDFGLFGGVPDDIEDPKIDSGSVILCIRLGGKWFGIALESCPMKDEIEEGG